MPVPKSLAFTEEPDGRVANQLRIRIANRGDGEDTYHLAVDGAPGATVVAPENPLRVAAGKTGETSIFVLLPRDAFDDGERRVTVTVRDGHAFVSQTPYRLVGPQGHDDDHHDRHR